MGSDAPSTTKLPKIDFSGVDTGSPGAGAWSVVRDEVMEALTAYGCFEAVYPKLSSELRSSVLDSLIKDLFRLPLETKLRNYSDKPFYGYIGQIPNLAYESLGIMNAEDPEGAQAFTSIMWPEGNPNFSETVHAYSKRLAELDQAVIKMVFESMKVEKYYDSQMNLHKYLLKVSEYGPPGEEEEKKLGLNPHRDKNTTSIICQNQVDGLEIETEDGEWYPAVPSPNSVIVIAGDALRAWTNGRVYSPMHRVVMGGSVMRYSSILFSIPNDDVVIQAPPELIDADHPPLFKPYDFGSYVRYCFTEEGQKANPQLDAFCGLSKQQEA
ncbi:probable 2-oxoglutarate-dependent dioxygenase AOP1 [Asparagus officinalis]|uniref:probable 2-oxoglutarate-dependent dioxygenase AOP1 n=1 Tax=Asparagus officinalis TaxID=4686 RepID=UPI00098E5F09|nr:probable 2-oxoglutarate-dependent dioxygenase AOP1 [Asparagus officinalis]